MSKKESRVFSFQKIGYFMSFLKPTERHVFFGTFLRKRKIYRDREIYSQGWIPDYLFTSFDFSG